MLWVTTFLYSLPYWLQIDLQLERTPYRVRDMDRKIVFCFYKGKNVDTLAIFACYKCNCYDSPASLLTFLCKKPVIPASKHLGTLTAFFTSAFPMIPIVCKTE